ncbi:MAG: hypothetical protein ACTS2F_09840 [Thainema sp.]
MSVLVDDMYHQARQGSVAAIIQILNEKLSESGVRTRAVLADGVLQLLCEAATPEQLDPSKLVNRIQQILEGIGPRNIRQVVINSRIVREQQLLWLEEIRRDPEGQLLWSQPITLRRPGLMRRIREDRQFQQHVRSRFQAPPSGNQSKKKLLIRGLVGGVSVIVLLGLVGWAMRDWLGFGGDPAPQPVVESTEGDGAPTVSTTEDPFALAVELAIQAAAEGSAAQTRSDWLDLATRWQRASDLMAQVPASHQRYDEAQQKVAEYAANSTLALQRAEQAQ